MNSRKLHLLKRRVHRKLFRRCAIFGVIATLVGWGFGFKFYLEEGTWTAMYLFGPVAPIAGIILAGRLYAEEYQGWMAYWVEMDQLREEQRREKV
jgi:predicted acyltransferase